MADKNSVIYRGKECRVERVDYYVKRGEYSHGTVWGWRLVDGDGNVLICSDPGRPRSAYEYQKPKFPTRKSLLERIAQDNAEEDRVLRCPHCSYKTFFRVGYETHVAQCQPKAEG